MSIYLWRVSSVRNPQAKQFHSKYRFCLQSEGSLIPIFSSGSFALDEAKRFDVSFTYTSGNNRGGTEGATASFLGYTASPIPEPETYAIFLAALGMMVFMARRRKA